MSIQVDSNLHETNRIYLLKIFIQGDPKIYETNGIYLLEIFIQGDSNMLETNRIYFFLVFILVDSNVNGTDRTTFLKTSNLKKKERSNISITLCLRQIEFRSKFFGEYSQRLKVTQSDSK